MAKPNKQCTDKKGYKAVTFGRKQMHTQLHMDKTKPCVSMVPEIDNKQGELIQYDVYYGHPP